MPSTPHSPSIAAAVPPPDVPFLHQHGAVLAGAGTGKTTATVAIQVAAAAASARAIVITFTNATVDDYIARANSVSPNLASRDNVFTFHKLAGRLLDGPDAPPATDVSLDTVVAVALEHVRARGLPPDMRDVALVLVDESQDCSRENYGLAMAVADASGAKVTMVGDANQSLYAFRNAGPDFLMGHAAREDAYSHALGVNWRSTPQIIALSAEFMRHPLAIAPRPEAEVGPLPRVLVRDTSAEVVRTVLATAAAAIARGMSVMVVGRSKRPRTEKGSTVRVGLQTVVNELVARGMRHVRMYREASDDDGGAGATASVLARDAVNVLTVHGSKGLETDVVVMIDAVDERLGDAPCPDQLEIMYVAVSRARTELVVVNARESRIDPILAAAARKGLCSIEGAIAATAHGVQRSPRDVSSVTQILSDRTVLPETELLAFARDLHIEAQSVARGDAGCDAPLPEREDLQTLYGTLAENCAQMVYAHSSTVPCVIERLGAYASRRISVSRQHARALTNLFSATGMRRTDAISRQALDALMHRLENDAQDAQRFERTVALLRHVDGEMRRRDLDSAVLVGSSATQRVSVQEVEAIAAAYAGAQCHADKLAPLFSACMFFFQLDHHSGYRWGRDYTAHVEAFRPHLRRIEGMVSALPPGCMFEKEVRFRSVRVQGRADICAAGKIIELKFSDGRLGLMHFMQPVVYALLDGDRARKRAEAWNLATGEKVFVKYDGSPANRWRVFRRLAHVTGRTVTLDDVEREDMCDGRVRLRTASLRATCDCTADEVEEMMDFVTSGTECVRHCAQDSAI